MALQRFLMMVLLYGEFENSVLLISFLHKRLVGLVLCS